MATEPATGPAVALTPIEAQALAERVAHAMVERDRASQALGICVGRVAPGFAELSMTIRGDMVNGHAICHGGLVFTLADSAFAFACNSHNFNTVAGGCSIEFMAPGREGDVLTATARERVQGRRAGVYDIDVRNQRGETIALFRGKSMRIAGHVV